MHVALNGSRKRKHSVSLWLSNAAVCQSVTYIFLMNLVLLWQSHTLAPLPDKSRNPICFPFSNPRQQGSMDKPCRTSLFSCDAADVITPSWRGAGGCLLLSPGIWGTGAQHLGNAFYKMWVECWCQGCKCHIRIRSDECVCVWGWDWSVSTAVILALFPAGCCLNTVKHSWYCFWLRNTATNLGFSKYFTL